MATRALRLRPDDAPDNWRPMPEKAPSEMKADEPTLARFLSLVGLFLATCGVLGLLSPALEFQYPISPGWAFVCLTLGAALMLLHALADSDLQFRRLYAVAALAMIVAGPVLRAIPGKDAVGVLFLPIGAPLMFVGLAFALAVLRHEDDSAWRTILRAALLIAGMTASLLPLGLASAGSTWMATDGAVCLLMGLIFLACYAGVADASSDLGHYAGLYLGGAALAYAMVASFGIYRGGQSFLVPSGILLITAGVVYAGFCLSICVDLPAIVMFRRELAALFFSPVAYLVLASLGAFAGVAFWMFADIVAQTSFGPRGPGSGLPEPILPYYFFGGIQIIPQMVIVPIITMRALSEEKRTGSLELLLTAAVNEGSIVVGKFLACWVFYLLTWLPWGVYLLSLRVLGGTEFDYRPILSFYATVGACGAAFIAMGLFFSSLTRNQIISAVLTFIGMLLLLAFYFVRPTSTRLADFVRSMSFVHYWDESARGFVSPQFLCVELSIAAFFVYLTVQVLSARKWS
jgi:ABC-2 type transport system permease protein